MSKEFSVKDKVFIDLLWESLKPCKGYPERKITGWGSKTKKGLIACINTINNEY